LQHSKQNKKEKSCLHKVHRGGKEKREEERRAGESLLLFLFPGDSKGEDRSDGGQSAVVSGMCFVHVFKCKYYKCPVILSQTLFFIQEFLKAITRSKEKKD